LSKMEVLKWSIDGFSYFCWFSCTYLCRLWTPPSICADVVLLSNFNSPEYIMDLQIEIQRTVEDKK
jgi:hypothetical protein